MQITFDPSNKDDTTLVRQLFMVTTQAPPTPEKEVEAPKPVSKPEKAAKAKPAEPAPVVTSAAPPVEAVVTPAATAPVTSTPAAPAQTLFSIDDVRKALMGYAAAVADADKDADKSKGKAKGQEKAKALLTSFIDTGKLSELPSAKYGDLLTAAANATAAVAK